MPGVMKIELKNLLFFAYHGLYAEERKAGNEYEINLTVTYQTDEKVIRSINNTVNYAVLYEIVKQEMTDPADLLETVAMSITEKIHVAFPQVKKIAIAVSKQHPPITKFMGHVGVSYEKEY